MSRRQMHLNLFQMAKSSQFSGGWRLRESDPAHSSDLDQLVEVAQLAEAGYLDSLFIADTNHLSPGFEYDENLWNFDPIPLVGALASRTTSIGLIATVSTSFSSPFAVARRFATLDHLSAGRAGWNIVTSAADAEARNFGQEALAEPEKRYERAAEFVDVTCKLWHSWADDAVVMDKASGIYADKDKVRPINHQGRHFRVAGPLTIPALPQGFPVLVQAGQSEAGREFAAHYAEIIFTAQNHLESSVALADDVRGRLQRYGRDSSSVKILPGLFTIVGRTEREAFELERELRDLILPERGFAAIRYATGLDLSAYEPDDPIPLEMIESQPLHGSAGSRAQLVAEWARRTRGTVRDLMFMSGQRGHRVLTGTPEQIADGMQDWFDRGACDGFNLIPSHFPNGLKDFVEGVIPILQDRGLFRRRYAGTTLREHCGLARPSSLP